MKSIYSAAGGEEGYQGERPPEGENAFSPAGPLDWNLKEQLDNMK